MNVVNAVSKFGVDACLERRWVLPLEVIEADRPWDGQSSGRRPAGEALGQVRRWGARVQLCQVGDGLGLECRQVDEQRRAVKAVLAEEAKLRR
ncbi:hypothetical protein [Micromonospora lupini]|uniref:Uncharacterized protein n=1 Tax=Micromonospora lupini str. Lupac 08 TaxID=1150864 RepID=I0L6M7_9ACTN|nr:hypothetical protein [Micromonospora lupini]CCH19474.1 hypothetical protein MILUP08_44349 [Micromonospora lupini str. Lupac 08]